MVQKQKQKAFKAVKAIKNDKKKTIKKDDDNKKKKKVDMSKKSYLNVDIHKIANKQRRNETLIWKQHEQSKIKAKERRQRQKEHQKNGTKALEPITTDDKREIDENQFVFESDEEELEKEEEMDEFADYFKEEKTPKILITTNERPKKQLFDFVKEIKEVIPNSYYWPRKNFSLKDICKFAPEKDYTDIMVWRENNRKVDELVMIHLPAGPTAIFKVSNVKLNQQLWNHARISDHYPELILNNFNTKVGRRIGRFFASLFPQKPEFKGRRVATFHTQRDFIFFRHHRYEFKDDGDRAALQEIGPRFTLKLKKLQLGTFDNLFGEIEFQAKDDMYVSRKATYI